MTLSCFRTLPALAAASALALAAAACASGGDDASTEGDRPEQSLMESAETAETPPSATTTATTTTTEAPMGPPHSADLPWGNFTLAERISTKLARGDQLNFVLSVEALNGTGNADAYAHGWARAGAEVSDQHGADINARIIGPHAADPEAQAATIEALIESGDIDCLAVDAASQRLFVSVIDSAVEAGIPTFSVGGDTPESKRFAYYGIDAFAAGETTGSLVGQWAADGGILVRRAGVLTGDAGDPQSFDMMRGFVAGLSVIHSGVEWVNEPATVESHGLEPNSVYDASEAWVLENIDVDIVFHTDAGLEQVSAVIANQLLYGDMYAAGFHVSEQVTDFIRERVVVAAMTQGLSEQAYRAGVACGDFLLGGAFESGHVVIVPKAVTRDNVDDLDWSLPENQ